jgi:CheY-like chemotaxis protein
MSMKVLVIDPDPQFLNTVCDLYEPRGHAVVHETDTAIAIARAHHWQPDVVIVSAEIERCCNGDLLSQLAQVEGRPAILLTAHMDRFDKAWRAWQRGADELLLKPVLHPADLDAAVLAARQNAVAAQEGCQALALSA